MTASIRERILAGLYARLQTLESGHDDVTVYRGRAQDVPDGKLPALSLDDAGNSRVDDQSCFGCTFYTMDVTVSLRATADTDAELGAALDDLYVRASKIILADYSQAGLAIDTHAAGLSAVEKSTGEGIGPLGAAEAQFQIEFQTVTGDPTLQF